MDNRIIARLKKMAGQQYEYDIDEAREDTITGLKNMARKLNDWSVRDTLCRLTKSYFYTGKRCDSLDEDAAEEVIDNLINFVASTNNEDDISDVYEAVERFIRR